MFWTRIRTVEKLEVVRFSQSHKDEVIDLTWELRVVKDGLGFVRFGHLDTWKLLMFCLD